MSSYYQLIRRDDQKDGTQIAYYRPSEHTQGAWNPMEQHMAPATGIICAELERYSPKENMRIGRISLDIYGLIHRSETKITTRCIRPGKTIELLESTFEANHRVCIVAHTWRMITEDTSAIEGIEDPPMPAPKELPYWKGMSAWEGGYITSITRHIKVAKRKPGKGQLWLTNPLDMVEGRPTSAFVKLMGMVDTMNGVVVRQKGTFTHMFPNLDLQIQLYRLPTGKWLGLDAQQQYGKDGIGLSSAVLHDINGPFGHAEQILTIRKATF